MTLNRYSDSEVTGSGSGIGDDELARLEAQGAATAPATRMIFAEAGIPAGMRVLDLGCGAGDVSFVAAALVGPGGSVGAASKSAEIAKTFWAMPLGLIAKPGPALNEVKPGCHFARTW